MAENLICAGNRVYSKQGRDNYARTFDGEEIPLECDDKWGFWGPDNGGITIDNFTRKVAEKVAAKLPGWAEQVKAKKKKNRP